MAHCSDEVWGLVKNELGLAKHGNMRVLEIGAGSCGFARRSLPHIADFVGEYVLSDVSAIRKHELENLKQFTTLKHDVNEALPEALPALDVVVACNALHVGKDVRASLAHIAHKLVVGGYLILEELIGDQCLFVWGLDKFIWETATDQRSFGLWMSAEEWRCLIEEIPGYRLVLARERPANVTLVLRRVWDAAVDGASCHAGVDAAVDDAAGAPVAEDVVGAGSTHVVRGRGEWLARTTAAAVSGKQRPTDLIEHWSCVNLAEKQCIVGDGSHGFLRSLQLEADACLTQALTTDGSLDLVTEVFEGRSQAGLVQFLTVDQGRVGTTVSVPVSALSADGLRGGCDKVLVDCIGRRPRDKVVDDFPRTPSTEAMASSTSTASEVDETSISSSRRPSSSSTTFGAVDEMVLRAKNKDSSPSTTGERRADNALGRTALDEGAIIPRLKEVAFAERSSSDDRSSSEQELTPPPRPHSEKRNFVLEIKKPGDLSSLGWEPSSSSSFSRNRSEKSGAKNSKVEVQFSALNFKDVMIALGQVCYLFPSYH